MQDDERSLIIHVGGRYTLARASESANGSSPDGVRD